MKPWHGQNWWQATQDEMEKFLIQAHQVAASLTDPEEKKQLLKDLATIR